MIKAVVSKIISVISRILITLRLHSRIINQLNKLRYESHKNDDHRNIISKLMENKKFVALDIGAQGGFFNS